MKGYIYTMFAGADPGKGWEMTDPILKPVPTMGACVPNIRRAVAPGDFVFVVSGKLPAVQQYVVGGFRVKEKIDALAAYGRFPNNRLHPDQAGKTVGNIIVGPNGERSPLDYHDVFERRIENYIVGEDPVLLESESEVERARNETTAALAKVFGRAGQRVYDIIGRGRKLNEEQIVNLLQWLQAVKTGQAWT